MNLIIVESPTKSKTISKYLSDDYIIKASIGHIKDLPKSNKQAIDIPAGFVPCYEIIKGKEKIVEEIKELSQKADEVILATDPDREGEAIAWHLVQALGLGNSKFEIRNSKQIPNSPPASMLRRAGKFQIPNIKRIVFHEITKQAVEEAIKHPRDIDMDLVKAQEARRVLDRLVGYDLSGLIWKKVRYGLSAGRVQSPALRIIMEREREIRAFIPENYWVIIGEFELANARTNADLTQKNADKNKLNIENKIILTCEVQPKDEKEAERIVKIGRANRWQIIKITQTEIKRSPYAPFITSTLQQTASSRLGFSPSRTMFVAQKLYEQGLITYMRTDSVNLSKEALPQIYREIEKQFGKEYLSPRTYITKSKSAQEAHEAIRPTNIGRHQAGANEEQQKLYRLIWQKTIASQMADAAILRTKISANVIANIREFPANSTNIIPNFSATGSIVVFPGWLAADIAARGEDVELPKVKENDPLKLLDIKSEGKQTEPPQRYTEAGLIKELEKRDIGRPSTYATIIKTILGRGYVIKEGRILKPTDTGEVVSDFLEKNFAKYISDSFTAEMENELDEIAEGKRKYEKMLTDFYGPFSKEVKNKDKTAEKITNLGDAPKEHKCPACDGAMIIKLSRTGKFLSCKKFPKCKGARKIDSSEIEEPKETGDFCPRCGQNADLRGLNAEKRRNKIGRLIEREGRFGKFIACSNYPKCKFVKTSDEAEAKASTGVKCPKCKDGEILQRRGRFGYFYSCSKYPECKFIMKSRPLTGKNPGEGIICEICGSLMMEGTKTIPNRCSNKNCQNYNPHKKT